MTSSASPGRAGTLGACRRRAGTTLTRGCPYQLLLLLLLLPLLLPLLLLLLLPLPPESLTTTPLPLLLPPP